MSPSMNPGVQQPDSTPNPSFPQLGRRINTSDGQSSVLQSSPSLSARQPPGGPALMQANQELLELRMIPAPTLAVLRQELGLSDREPIQMTPAERQRLLGAYRQRRRPDAAGPAAGLQLPNPAELRAPPQMNGSTTRRVPQGGQLPMGNPMNMGIGQPPLELEYRMQNLQLEGTMHPRAPTNQSPTGAINGVPNSNIAQSPSSILGTPLNPRPIVNPQSVLADSLFPPGFMQHLSDSLDDFDTDMFPAETDINFEREFGQWFNGDDVQLDVE